MIATRLTIAAPVDLWATDLLQQPDSRGLALLSADERARAGQLHFERDRRYYFVAHIALRQVLARYADSAAGELRFEAGAYGKPRLAKHARLGFSLSYAGDTALIGVAHDEDLGVDVECVRIVDDVEAMSDSVFARVEHAAIVATPAGTARDTMFLRGWTRKEACVKATGTGLSTLPSSFESGLDAETRRTALDTGEVIADVEVGSFEFGGRLLGAWARLV